MQAPPGFTADEEIDRGPRSVVRRARRDADGARVILKQLATAAPTPRDLARYRFAHELNQQFDQPGICRSLDLVAVDDRPVLVLEDVGGTSLRRRLDVGPLPWTDGVEVGIAVAEALACLHDAGVLHRDVNPSNIVQGADGRVQLIDFDLATRLERSAVAADSPNRLEGTLTHIAPEQTGRMNRSVDQRSDLYSLGVTLHELLAGRRPFADSHDPLTLVHQHLALEPEPLTGVPASVAAIVARCLAKAPESRYQTAAGLAADLRRCLGSSEPFPLGADDDDGRLRIPEAL